MNELLDQLPSIAISVITLWGFWVIGKKRRHGWLIAMVAELGWVGLSIWLAQWGLLLMCGVFLVVYWRNYREWADD